MGIIFLIISILSPVPAIYAGRHNPRSTLSIYLMLAFIMDLSIIIAKRGLHLNPEWEANTFLLIEMACFYYYFHERGIIPSRIAFWAVVLVAVTFFILHTLLVFSWSQFNTSAYSIILITYILLSILGYMHILRAQKTAYLGDSSFFWSNTAILVYACGVFFIFLFKDRVYNTNAAQLGKLWAYGFLTFNITKNLLLAVALSKKRTVE